MPSLRRNRIHAVCSGSTCFLTKAQRLITHRSSQSGQSSSSIANFPHQTNLKRKRSISISALPRVLLEAFSPGVWGEGFDPSRTYVSIGFVNDLGAIALGIQSSDMKHPKYLKTPGCESAERIHAEWNSFFDWVAKFKPCRGEAVTDRIQNASAKPPMPFEMIEKLDITTYMRNPVVRHEANFNTNLFFAGSPVSHGSNGNDDYWLALEVELEYYAFLLNDEAGADFRGTTKWIAKFREWQKRLPTALDEMRKILLMLTPEKHQQQVEEELAPKSIMLQIEQGTFDLAGLARMLSKMIKTYCAPKRDAAVDEMVDLLSRGHRSSDASLMVEGFRALFSLFYAMKLDVANHQLPHAIPGILADAVRFGQAQAESFIFDGTVKQETALSWFSEDIGAIQPSTSIDPLLSKLAARLLHSLMPSKNAEEQIHDLPQTFRLDRERLLKIQKDISKLVFEEVAVSRLRDIMRMFHRCEKCQEHGVDSLRKVLPIITGDLSLDKTLSNVSAQLVRIASTKSKTCIREAFRVEPDGVAQAVICGTAENLLHHFSGPESDLFCAKSKLVHGRLLERVLSLVEKNFDQDPVGLYEELVEKPEKLSADVEGSSPSPGSSVSHSDRKDSQSESPKIDDISRKVAHIALLHWKIWAPLLYRRDAEDKETTSDCDGASTKLHGSEETSPASGSTEVDERVSSLGAAKN